jgi:hypothetical protein
MAKPSSNGWADSKTAWKKRAGPHNVTLGSGTKVTIKVFGVGELLLHNAIPETLRDTVALHLLNLNQGGISAVIGGDLIELNRNGTDPAESEKFQQRLRASAELTKLLVVEALVDPKLTLDELDEIPWEDQEELMRLCTGQQAFDSRGVRIGVEPVDSWATFQDEHRDGPCMGADCERCQRARQALSSLHVVSV